MNTLKKQRTLPMKTAGTQHLIERTYRESGRFQWAREVTQNALEAGATRIEFGIEWQAVEKHGVYRRTICDNGSGMTAEKLVEFFNTFGGGGKPIGGVHENFGVGSKTSLLPWNTYGLIVVSWVNGDASMIWVHKDKDTGEYGLRQFETTDDEGVMSLESVVEPFFDHHRGCDWSKIKPSWIDKNGTVIVLLGTNGRTDTVMGDPNRDEDDLKGLAAYLNRRFWEVPEGVTITVDELRVNERKDWPRNEQEAHGREPKDGSVDRRTNRRQVMGAKYYVEYPNPNFKKGKLSASGCVSLRDSTKIHWYLWDGERPGVQSYAAYQGYMGALYKNELYDVTSHLSTYRSFGVADASVRQRLWIVLQPQPLDENGKKGVYPRTDRNALLLKGGPDAGGPLPIHSWAAEFSDNMPEEIQEALRQARGTEEGTIDESYRLRLADRWGARWRLERLRRHSRGSEMMDANQPGGIPGETAIRKKPKKQESETGEPMGGTAGGMTGKPTIGTEAGEHKAVKAKVGGGIPVYRPAHSEEFEPGILAAWQPHDPSHPEGVVLLNTDHPVLNQQIKYWTSQFADHLATDVEREVISVYGEVAVSKIAHSESLKALMPADKVERELRSDSALTLALLGLFAEEAVLTARLGAKFGRRKAVPEHQAAA